MEDDNIGKEGPGHFTEHGDEEGEDSDSGGSNVEEEHVRPYEHDPSFKSKEELEHFLKGCDNRIESESDSEDENVDYESWRGVRKLCHCTVDIVKILSRMASNTCAVSRWTSGRKMLTNRAEVVGFSMATNVFAVSNMCYQLMRRKGRKLFGNRSHDVKRLSGDSASVRPLALD